MGVFATKLKPLRSRRLETAEGLFGILLIAATCFVVNDRISFPGAWAILPTFGAALVIHAGPAGWINAGWLAARPLRHVGLISYPLYLWHWPLFAFLALLGGGANDAQRRLFAVFVVVLSFVLAETTYRLVELPLRGRDHSSAHWSKVATGLCLVVALLGGAGAVIFWQRGLPGRAFGKDDVLATRAMFDVSMTPKERRCPAEFSDVEYCMVGSLDRPVTDVLLGDSHANHFYPGLARLFDADASRNLLVLAQSGTPPLRHVGVLRRQKQTDDRLLEYAARTPSVRRVYLAAFWSNYSDSPDPNPKAPGRYFEEPLVDLDHDTPAATKDDLVAAALRKTIDYLAGAGKEVTVLLDVPRLPFPLATCLPRPYEIQLPRASSCDLRRGHSQVDRNRIREVIREVVLHDPTAKLFDPVPQFCGASVCKVMDGDTILYGDEHHLSIRGAEWLFERAPLP